MPRRIVSTLLFPTGPVRRVSWALFCLLAVAMVVLAPYLLLPQDLPVVSNDKLMHVLVFAGFGGLAWIGFGGRRTLLPIGTAIALALIDEGVQLFTAGRHASAADVAADAVGASCAVIVLTAWRHVHRRRSDE